jgi:hypothetical protein
MIKCSDAMPSREKRRDHRAPNPTGSTGYKDNAGCGFGHGVLQICLYVMLRVGDVSSGTTSRRHPHTLSAILTARAVNGKPSRLALASSPGALSAPK